MLKLIAARVTQALLTLLAISVIVFVGTSLLPGDVASAMLGQSATPEALAALRTTLHLDQPAAVRYITWLGGLLTGDPGTSLVTHLPVAQMIGGRLGNSLLLAGLTTLIAVPVSLALGMAAAIWQGLELRPRHHDRNHRRHLRAGLPGGDGGRDPVLGRAAMAARGVHRQFVCRTRYRQRARAPATGFIAGGGSRGYRFLRPEPPIEDLRHKFSPKCQPANGLLRNPRRQANRVDGSGRTDS